MRERVFVCVTCQVVVEVFIISSTDSTAANVGLDATSTNDIIIGDNLNRQTVTAGTLMADLNQRDGIDTGSFTITDSAGAVGAINIKVDDITTVGNLVDAVNALSIAVTASLNDAGDGIALVDTAAGSSTLTVVDTGTGTAAADLGIAGAAVVQTVAGVSVSALVRYAVCRNFHRCNRHPCIARR